MGKIIYDFTANPFVDAGIWAISERAKKKPNELNKADLKGIIDDVIKLYLTKKWSKNIYSVFPNNPITNPSVKNKDERYSALLNELIDGIGPLGNSGDCIACGKRDVQQRSGKDKNTINGIRKID
jgi:CRISPR-associated protein Cst1